MKFILKEGLIHVVGNYGLPNNNIEGEVVSEDLHGFDLQVSFNNKPYIKFYNKISIPQEVLKEPSIQITVRAIKESDIRYFKSDTFPLTHAIIFGKSLEESYPEVINNLFKRIEKVEKLLNLKEKEIQKEVTLTKEQVHKEVTLTKEQIHNYMLELVDTFEEITKKGSLF